MFSEIKEECGIFGIYNNMESDVAGKVYHGIYALQHRGQESCGIVVNDMGLFTQHRDLGLVPEVFTKESIEKLGRGNMAVGHVMNNSGKPDSASVQPTLIKHVKGQMALSYNGCLVNAMELKRQYELGGAIFHNSTDAEVIAYAITEQRLNSKSIEEAVLKAMYNLRGAYCLLVMSPRKLIAVRDPDGLKPLCMGKCADGSIVFASESCALDIIDAKLIRDLLPGEVVVAGDSGITSIKEHCGEKSSMCVFEFVYFARPDSVLEGTTVQTARKKAGEILAAEHPVEADVVIGVPDSGLDAAIGYAEKSGIPYAIGFIKNRYVGRTFIQPSQSEREHSVKIKLNVIREVVAGKRVVLVDDSVVRGTTSIPVVNLLREAGASQVHMRISSPPYMHPCYFG
ncbi:MAG: amidophosphoribosyltransferase, partial [Oscillospiraceae bacterium]|nr:amidophosphoribosyltransferase [Oscillospiraceae bacterium]